MNQFISPLDKKTILLISNGPIQSNQLLDLLESHYDLIFAENETLANNLLKVFQNRLCAILLDTKIAIQDDARFLKQMHSNSLFHQLPILLLSSALPSDEEISCLAYGVVDFITEPFHPRILMNRIENAIRSRDSASFHEIERMLRELPSNIYIKDAEAKYIFATKEWHYIDHSGDPNWTIRGKTDLDIRKDRENARLSYEKDTELLATGIGQNYMIETNENGVVEFFEVIKQPIRNNEGAIVGIIGLVNNITEHEKIKRKFKIAACTDGLTGLYNRKETQSRIEQEIKYFRSSGKPFSLIMIDIDNFKQVNDIYGHKAGDLVIITLAKLLKNEQKPWGKYGIAGRWGGEEFMIVLSEVNAVEAGAFAEQIRASFETTSFSEIPNQTVSIGVTESTHADTSDSICMRVDTALYHAKTSGKNRVSNTTDKTERA